MLRTAGALLVLLVAGANGSGFWKPILLPDSLGGVGLPEFITWNAANDLVYVGSRTSPRLVAFDAGTCTRVAVVDVGRAITAACANAAENKVYVALMSNHTIAVIDGGTNSVVRTVTMDVAGDIDRFCLNPARNKLYCLDSTENRIGIIKCETDKVIATLCVGERPSALACDSSSGDVFCANKGDGTVCVIDGVSDSVKTVITVGQAPQALCPVAPAAKMYCANGLDATVSVIDCSSLSVCATAPVGNGPTDMCYAPDVNKLYCANSGRSWALRDSTVTAIDCATDSVVATVNVHWSPNKLAWWPHRSEVFVAFGSRDLLAAIDTKADQVTNSVYVCTGKHSFAYASTDGNLFCTSDYSGTVRGILSREPQYTTVEPGIRASNLCVNPRYDKLYFTEWSDFEGRLTVMSGQTGEPIRRIEVPMSGAYRLCYNTRNDKLYMSGYSDDSIYVVDGTSDTIVAELACGPGPLGLCYDSVANRVYCANRGDGTVTVFDGQTDSVLATIALPQNPDDFVCAPDIGRIYYTSWDEPGLRAIDCRNNRLDTAFRVDVDDDRLAPLCYNPDDHRVYFAEFGSGGDRLLAADAKGKVHEVVAMPGWPTSLCYDEESKRLVCTYHPNCYYPAYSYDTKVALIDCRSRKIVADLDPEAGAGCLVAVGGSAYLLCSIASSILVLDGLATLGKVAPTPCVIGRTRLTGLRNGPAVATVYDLGGRLRAKQELIVSAGEVVAPLSGLPAGVYFVRLKSGDTQARSYKVVYVK